MKKILKTLGFGMIFGFGAFLVLGLGYFFIKARQTTNTTTDTEPNKLYVGAGEILTATKRNSLVDKSSSKTFYICTNTDTSTPCAEAKSNGGQGTVNYRTINCLYPTILANGDAIQYNGGGWKFRDNTGTYYNCTDGSVIVMNLNK